jgi:hypothetical protein
MGSIDIEPDDNDEVEEFDFGWATFQGSALSDEESTELEASLKESPDDLELRAQLLGFYSKKEWDSREPNPNRIDHVLWTIKNVPDCGLGRTPYLQICKEHFPEAHRDAQRLVADQCKQHWNNADILFDLGSFYRFDNPIEAERILHRAHEIADNKSHTGFWLSQVLHDLGVRNDDREKLEHGITVLQQAISDSDPDWSQLTLLCKLAKLSFDAGRSELAKQTSLEMLTKVEAVEPHNRGQAVHVAHTVLGRLALKAGDADTAKQELLASCKVEGGPRLGSYGPQMQLAQELLERGEKECVLQYLDRCRSFWEMSDGKLEIWMAAIRGDSTPALEADAW